MRLLALLCVLGPVACDEQATTTNVSTVDSAGVLIVNSPDSDAPARTVATEPLLTLGGVEVAGATQFGYIENVVLDRAGRIWVSDQQASDIRVFTMDGDHLGTLGGVGDGPGEYRALALLGVTPDGNIVATDRRKGRVDWYGPDLDIHRSSRIEPGMGTIAIASAGDSALLLQLDTWRSSLRTVDRERTVSAFEIAHWMGQELDLRVIGQFPSVDRVSMDRVSVPMPLTSGPGMGGSRMTWVAGPHSYEIREYSLEGLEALYRVAREPGPVSGELLDRLRSSARDQHSGQGLRRQLELLRRDDLPASAPTWIRLVAGLDGTIWVQRWSPTPDTTSLWDLFSASGAFLGHVELPAGFRLTSADSDVVVGSWHDELDVPHVRAYRLKGR